MDTKTALFHYCLRLGDTNLILGHRLSEMCSRAPMLEEDIALANLALDHIGQAEALLHYAAAVEGRNRSEDDLAYLRPEWDYRNCLLAEQPNTDFAFVIARQFLIDVYQCLTYDALQQSADETLAGMGGRFLKEAVYHRRHSTSWVIRLALGTEESRTRLERAFRELWKYTGELLAGTQADATLAAANLVPDPDPIQSLWKTEVEKIFAQAGLEAPAVAPSLPTTGKPVAHTEYLGHLLAEMQYLQRAFPGATW